MRIAVFVPSLRGGGAERVMLDLAHGFAERGITTDLVLPQVEGPYLSEVRSDVRIVNLEARRVLASLPGLVGYLRRERPHALLSTLTHANLVALWARRLSGVATRVVVREANTLTQVTRGAGRDRRRFLPFLVRRFYPWADGIVAVSTGVAQDLETGSGIAAERMHILPNPVVTPELTSKAAEALDHAWFRAGQPPVVLGVGRLSKQKDFATLIRAFDRVRRAREARLMILGEGPERPGLEALVAGLGLSEQVMLPGFASNPFAYMARAGVFVLSSAWEGMPGALIQAAACGVPVVATDCESGPREVLQGGRYGRLVPVGDPAALAEAILTTLERPRTAVPFEAVERFTRSAAVSGYLEVLRGAQGD
jgi:glycosyltransferase involved in cell wall biosynthesis